LLIQQQPTRTMKAIQFCEKAFVFVCETIHSEFSIIQLHELFA
jgi:hypothetical protein